MLRTVLTYGTFDLFHVGHLSLLRRLRLLGDRLVVGVSTDAFNAEKGKTTIIGYADRAAIVASTRYVDLVFPETSWKQKIRDIKKYQVTTFAMGDDWTGRFDFLRKYCEVIYLPRTQSISTTELKRQIARRATPDLVAHEAFAGRVQIR
jgi:glycerol-3-phosphate cytidylyltransferase